MDNDYSFSEKASASLEREVEEFDVETADGPKRALELMDEKDYDAVVSNYQFSEMNGLKFLEKVRSGRNSNIPFIIFAEEYQEEAAIEALNHGADRYLPRFENKKLQYSVLAEAVIHEIEWMEKSRKLEGKTEMIEEVIDSYFLREFQEITEEKGDREKLRESKEKYRSIIENMNEIVYVLNENSEIEYVSPNVEEISGYSPSELAGKSFIEFVYPDDENGRIERFGEALSGEKKSSEYRYITKDGDVRWMKTNANPIIEEGETIGIQGILTDITEQKEIEKEIRNREKLERIITNFSINLMNADVGEVNERINQGLKIIGEFLDADRSYIFQFYNDLEKMSNTHEWCAEGIDPQKDNLQNISTDTFPWWMEKLKNFENIPIPKVSDLPTEAKAEKEILQEQNIESLIVIPMVSKNSLKGYLGLDWVKEGKLSDEFINLLRISGGVIASALERKEIEEDLIETKNQLSEGIKKYRNMTEASPDTILLIDHETQKIIDANSKAEDLFQMPRDVIINEDFSEFRPQREAEKYDDIISSETKTSVKESLVIDREGNEIPVEISGSHIKFKNKDVAYCVFRDISDRKKVEEREELIHSILRHDLRNKLQIMQGYHDLLKDFDLPDNCEEYLSMAEQGTKEGIEIIEKVRNLREAQEEQTKKLKIESVLRDAIQKARKIGKQEGVKIEEDLPKEEHKVKGGSLLIQVFSNILENAISHSEGDLIRVREKVNDDEITCIIEDNGKGLSDDQKTQVFKKGYTTDEERGTGLGMFLVKTLLEIYDGEIKIKDSDLSGARFDIGLKRT